MSNRYVITDHGGHGTSAVDSGPDAGGTLRGISLDEGRFTAVLSSTTRTYRTLAGARRFMARMGYDSYGRQLDREGSA